MITISRNLMEQKIEKISSNMHKIKENLTPDTPPIFVELLGTPKSGKTTILKFLLEGKLQSIIQWQRMRKNTTYGWY